MRSSSSRSWPARALREPTVQFALLGALIFFLDAAVRRPEPVAAEAWVGPTSRVQLEAEYRKESGRDAIGDEGGVLLEQFIDDEVLYREALALGLDRNDTIVRRRLIQKMQFLAEEPGAIAEPDEAALEAQLRANPTRYARPERIDFEQVYFSADARGAEVGAAAARAGQQLARGEAVDGDPFMISRTISRASLAEVERDFGLAFARALAGCTVAAWCGPLASEYGQHLVRIAARLPGGLPALAEVRERVADDVRQAQRKASQRAFITALRKKHGVAGEATRLSLAPPSLMSEETR